MNLKNKKAAMEMSVGTIVTIVLLMSVLVLGIFLIKQIFFGATESVALTQQAVKNEINKLFSEQSDKKVIVVPESRSVSIKKGESNLGFGFMIRNTGDEGRFSYSVSAKEVSCKMRLAEAEDLITLGKEGNDIIIPGGDKMDDPVFVRFNIPETATPCDIRYALDINKDREPYASSLYVDLKILPK